MSDKTVLKDGLVNEAQYKDLTRSKFFREIENYSDDFISKVGPMIQSYNIRWVGDPFHQWSRQWEYSYIISQLKKVKKDARIVDLGAGVSFLPYYLKEKLGLSNILAVDYDRSLEALYEKVNTNVNETVSFQFGDMRNLENIQDSSADVVYSVSVLEHTDSYSAVLQEIYRILKPGGSLSLTFDISLDGLDDIPLKRAKHLIASIELVFDITLDINLDIAITRPDLITSGAMAKKDKSLMPWKYPSLNVIRHLVKHGKPGRRYKNLTFYCLTVKKPLDSQKVSSTVRVKESDGFDDKYYWKNRHAHVNNIKASGLKSVGIKANHYIYRILTEQYARILSRVDLTNVKSILDCGFGDGHFLKFFSNNHPDKKLTGVDISEAAKDKIDFVPKKDLHVADLSSFKLNEKADLVHCFDVLYHILKESDHRAALENLADHSNKYIALHEKFVHKSPRFSSAHVRFRRREFTNQVLNSKGFYLHAEIPTHFIGVRFFTYRLNKLIPGILYKIDNYIAKHFPEHLQEVLGTHSIRIYKKAD